jgi:hypothetical protein
MFVLKMETNPVHSFQNLAVKGIHNNLLAAPTTFFHQDGSSIESGSKSNRLSLFCFLSLIKATGKLDFQVTGNPTNQELARSMPMGLPEDSQFCGTHDGS